MKKILLLFSLLSFSLPSLAQYTPAQKDSIIDRKLPTSSSANPTNKVVNQVAKVLNSGSNQQSNNVYVSPTGSDATGQRGNADRPFFTLSGAKTAYQTGDVIRVNPGTYTGQTSLEIAGQDVEYDFAPGAKVTFSGRVINNPSANITVRGQGWFIGTDFYFNTSFNYTSIFEFDRMDLSGQMYMRKGTHYIKGRILNLGSSSNFGIQTGANGTMEVENFTHLATVSEAFTTDYTTFIFYRTVFNWSGYFPIYSNTGASAYSHLVFDGCTINCKSFITLAGTGGSNILHGDVTFRKTTINATEHGIRIQKWMPDSKLIFDGCNINAASGYKSLEANTYYVAGGGVDPADALEQPRNIKIDITSAGLTVNRDMDDHFINMTPGTTAVLADGSGVTAFTSAKTSLKVYQESILTTAKGTAGQVPVYNANGTTTPGTVSGGGISDAPSDGTTYGRNNGAWTAVSGGGTTTNSLSFSSPLSTTGAFNGSVARTVGIDSTYWTSRYVKFTGSYANPIWITSLAYSKLTGAPTLSTVASTGDYNDLSNKPTIPTSTTGLAEGTNLYFTNARAIGSTLTGWTSGVGTVSSADDIKGALQKIDGNVSANTAAIALKAADNAVVHLTGAESVAGVKTFSSPPILPTPSPGDNSTKGATTAYVDGAVTAIGAVSATSTTTFSNKTISGANNTLSNIAESSVTNLTTDLAAKGNLAGGNTWTGLQTMTSRADAVSTLTYAATTNIDLSGADVRTISLTGNVSFTTSNITSGKAVTTYITCDATLRTFTFPGTWIWVSVIPANIAVSKHGILSLYSPDGSSIYASYVAQQN